MGNIKRFIVIYLFIVTTLIGIKGVRSGPFLRG
jgi:hypothetical protein